jgi:hypothetical protein
MTAWLILVGVVVVVGLVLVALVSRRRAAPDDIASLRRQIDALSPEARRPTIERMNPSVNDRNDDDGADDS